MTATILVVEDNPVTRKTVRMALASEGYRVLEADTGAHALETVTAQLPDLILQDIVLPDVSGFDLVAQLRRVRGVDRVPIIAFTSFLSAVEEGNIAAAGFDDVLVKPAEPSRILQAVRAHLSGLPSGHGSDETSLHVLLIHDDDVQLRVERQRLERSGFVVTTASDGRSGLEAARTRLPDVIVADVLLPTIDGFDLCEVARRDPRLTGVPVVLLSSLAVDEEARERARRSGAFDLVSRTPEMSNVAAVIVAAVRAPRVDPGVAPIAPVERVEYDPRLIRQLQRQVALRSDIARRVSLQAAALSVLSTIADTLAQRGDTASSLQDVLTRCVDAAGLSRAAILMRTDAAWRCIAHVGYRGEIADGLSTLFGHIELLDMTLDENKSLSIPSPQVPAQAAKELLQRANAAGAVLAPLNAHSDGQGVLLFDSASKSLGGEEWLAFAHTVAFQVGQAIALSRTFERLAQSEERYRLLFEHTPLASWVFDRETHRILAVNEAAERAYGYSRKEFLDLTIDVLRPPEDVPRLQHELGRPPRRLHPVGLWRHRTKAGETIDVDISACSLTWEGRAAELVVMHDVTARERTERELREVQRHLAQALTSSNAVLYVRLLRGGELHGVWASENIVRFMGYSVEEALADGWWMAGVHPQDVAHALASQNELARTGHMVAEYRFRHRSGHYRWVRDDSRVVSDSFGEGAEVVGVWVDVTERRQLEEQFRQAQKMEAVGRLAGGVAHDFNNLLTAITGYSDLLLLDLDPEDVRRQDVAEIKRAALAAADLTRQLLAFSRRQILAPRVVDLNALVSGARKLLGRLIGEDIALATSLDPGLAAVRADPGQLEQVIMNLAVNARDAMPNGGRLTIETANVTIDREFGPERVAQTPGPYVMMAVSDTGVGMDEATKARIFEPFFTTKEAGKGTGLGLATVYGIVKQSEGFIWVYSEPGNGSTFKIYLPRVDEPPESLESSLPPARSWNGTETVLVAEDTAAVRAVVREVLERHGYTVIEAATGKEAAQLASRRPGRIDLLVTDVVMPELSGRDLVRTLRTTRPDLKVLYMSGYTDDAVLRQGMLEPAAAFLQKPFRPEDLARRVRQILDGTAPPAPPTPNG
ncbi:MAG TPA: response regulator [Gemmatimonadaceae bacterium]|nr:response regulator [Gemmatimonadaceae bacterium]